MIFTQKYVGDMCEAIDSMKITAKQKEFARAVMRSAIDYANAKNNMHASPGAKARAAAFASHERSHQGDRK
jgi:hypothetical protein